MSSTLEANKNNPTYSGNYNSLNNVKNLQARPVFGIVSNNVKAVISNRETSGIPAPGKENANYVWRRKLVCESGSGDLKSLVQNDCSKESKCRKVDFQSSKAEIIVYNNSPQTLIKSENKTPTSQPIDAREIVTTKSRIALDVARMAFDKETMNYDTFLAQFEYSDCSPTTVNASERFMEVTDYAIGIVAHEQTREEKACFKLNDFIRLGTQPLTPDMIVTLADWMIEMQEHFHYRHETFHLAWGLLYAFLGQSPPIARENIQLYALTAIYLACKQEEVKLPKITTLLYGTGDAYSIDNFFQAERRLLSCIDYNVHRPNPYFFLRSYCRVFDANSRPVQCMCCFILDAGMHSHSVNLARESQKAAAALWLARRVLGNPSYVVWRQQSEIARLYCLIASDDRLMALYLSSGGVAASTMNSTRRNLGGVDTNRQPLHQKTSNTDLAISNQMDPKKPPLDPEILKKIAHLCEMEDQRSCVWPPLLQHTSGYSEADLIPLALQYHAIAMQLLAEVARGGQLEGEMEEGERTETEEAEEDCKATETVDSSFTDLGPLDDELDSESGQQISYQRCASPGGHQLRQQLVSKYYQPAYLEVADTYPQQSFNNLIPYFPEIRCFADCRCFVCTNLVNPKRRP